MAAYSNILGQIPRMRIQTRLPKLHSHCCSIGASDVEERALTRTGLLVSFHQEPVWGGHWESSSFFFLQVVCR